ncbi:MAG TPA: hypothetical protein VGE40_07960 [Bacilli bacterium]
MVSRVLPLGQPPIIGYNYLSFPLSIMTNHEEYLPWFYSNYIQLCCSADFLEQGTMNFDFYNYDFTVHPLPWLDIQRISRELIFASYSDIKKFLMDSLDRGCYIYLFLDEFHLSHKTMHLSKHFYHDNFIYGYNDKEKMFNTVGFDKTRLFTNTLMPFSELDASFNGVEMIKDELNYIHLFRFNSNGQYDFDINLVIGLLQDFLQARNTSEHFSLFKNPNKQAYGMDVYRCIIEYFENLTAGNITCDVRPFHILWEHKKCMMAKLIYMENRYQSNDLQLIRQSYEEIEKASLVIRNVIIKYYATRNEKLILNNIEAIHKLMNRERELFSQLVDLLELVAQAPHSVERR